MEFIGMALVLGGHIAFTNFDINAALQCFQEWQEEHKRFSEQFKEDLLKKSAETILNVNKLGVNFAVFFVCAALRMMGQQGTFRSFFIFLSALVVYSYHAFFARVKITADYLRMMSLLSLLCQSLLVFSVWDETALENILFCEKLCALSVIFCSLMTLDFKFTLPMHVLSAVVFTYKHWQIVGFETVTPLMVYTSICWNFGLGILIVLILHTIKASIAAKRETLESSSLMLGFQKVLRGVCDGDVVLQRSNGTIVEDAACLERLLKSSSKLQNTNFMDLFLDVQSRDAFQTFLSADATEESLPTGLRVSLQGAHGPVSMDLFHTKIPRDGGSSDYSVLAPFMRAIGSDAFVNKVPPSEQLKANCVMCSKDPGA
eukprot:Skav213166  [mRNA]  locus=scaffold11:8227:9345:+ [translate_table: standard]